MQCPSLRPKRKFTTNLKNTIRSLGTVRSMYSIKKYSKIHK